MLCKHDGPNDEGWLADSPLRQQRIQQLACKFGPDTDYGPKAQDITRMLDDHDYFPYSICRYEEGPLGMDATLFSIVMELKSKVATVYLGRPCNSEETIELRI